MWDLRDRIRAGGGRKKTNSHISLCSESGPGEIPMFAESERRCKDLIHADAARAENAHTAAQMLRLEQTASFVRLREEKTTETLGQM